MRVLARLEHYIPVGKQRLRCGYTTGTCAAGAARAAAEALLTGRFPAVVRVDTPAGIPVELEILDPALAADHANCAVVKDGGDDPDVTDGAKICCRVERIPAGFVSDGGRGVGRVTRPGLDQAVGEAAINRVPREMIRAQLAAAAAAAGYAGGLKCVVSVPEGERLAQKTFNPRLGIEGGISILGTGGIVRPMSEEALIQSLYLELDMAFAAGHREILMSPGNYGERWAREELKLDMENYVSCSNYLGLALDHAAGLGVQSVLLVCHLGKLSKVAAGAMNTHSRVADGRAEALCTHTALAGGDTALCRRVYEAPTTDGALELLEAAGLRTRVMETLLDAAWGHLRRRAGETMEVQAVCFSNRFGPLGETPGAGAWMARHRIEEEQV